MCIWWGRGGRLIRVADSVGRKLCHRERECLCRCEGWVV